MRARQRVRLRRQRVQTAAKKVEEKRRAKGHPDPADPKSVRTGGLRSNNGEPRALVQSRDDDLVLLGDRRGDVVRDERVELETGHQCCVALIGGEIAV